MNKWLTKLDRKYLKICTYAGGCVLVTALAGYLIYRCFPFFQKLGTLTMAVLRPLIIGLVLSYLLDPLVRRAERTLFSEKQREKGWPRTLSVLLVLAGVIILIVVFLVLISSTFVKQINVESLLSVIDSIAADFDNLSAQVTAYLEKFNISIPRIGSSVTGMISSFASGASTFFFGVIFAVYFMIDGDRISSYWKNVIHRVLEPRAIAWINEMMTDADRCFSGYIRGQSLDALLMGVTVSLVLTLVGMPYAVVIGLLTGIGNLIPYVGPVLGYGSVILVNVMNWNPQMLIIGIVILAIIMFIDGNIVNPRLLAGSISVHPLLVVASLLAGGAIGGLLGMLLAVPVGAFVKLQFEKWIAGRELKQAKSTAGK